jgi:hypothetical protein
MVVGVKGFWILDFRLRIVGCAISDVGCAMSDVGCVMSDVISQLLTIPELVSLRQSSRLVEGAP